MFWLSCKLGRAVGRNRIHSFCPNRCPQHIVKDSNGTQRLMQSRIMPDFLGHFGMAMSLPVTTLAASPKPTFPDSRIGRFLKFRTPIAIRDCAKCMGGIGDCMIKGLSVHFTGELKGVVALLLACKLHQKHVDAFEATPASFWR